MPVSNSWVRILCKGINWYLTNAVSREILYYHHHFVSFCIVEIMWYLFVRKLIFKKIFSNVIKAICNFKRCYYNLFMEVWDTPWTVTNQIKFRCVPPPLDQMSWHIYRVMALRVFRWAILLSLAGFGCSFDVFNKNETDFVDNMVQKVMACKNIPGKN